MRLVLIRHAASAPAPDLAEPLWPLSEEGDAQAQALATLLSARGVDPDCVVRLVSSPYLRALQTLRPLANRLGLPLYQHRDLAERRLSSLRLDDWRAQLARTWKDFDYVLPGGESSRACQNRVCSALQQIAQQHADHDTVAVCSHGNAIALFLQHLQPTFGFDDWATMGNPEIYLCRHSPEGFELMA
ncbi:MAG: histidine phosphatase family protein [Pseudomonadota bacterium]